MKFKCQVKFICLPEYHMQSLNGLSGLKQQQVLNHLRHSEEEKRKIPRNLRTQGNNRINLGRGNSKRDFATSMSGGVIGAVVEKTEITKNEQNH